MALPAILLKLIFFCTLCRVVRALPISLLPDEQTDPLVYPLSVLPLLALAVCKFFYVRLRTVQSIGAADRVVQAGASSTPIHFRLWNKYKIEIKLAQTGYIIGFLGSPQWETRSRRKADRSGRTSRPASSATSKPPSSVLYSWILRDSSRSSGTGTPRHSAGGRRSQSRSRSASVRNVSIQSPVPHFDIASCASVHPSSPACTSEIPPSSSPVAQIPPRNITGPAEYPSPTLMQMMKPVLASWYDDTSGTETFTDHEKSTSTSNGSTATGEKSRDRSQSPTPPFETPPMTPQPTSPASTTISLDIPRRKEMPSIASSLLTIDSIERLTVSVYEGPALARPTPIHIAKPHHGSIGSTIVERSIGRVNEMSAIEKLLHSPTHRSPPTPPNIYSLVSTSISTPHTPSTRPLNVAPEHMPSPTPTSPPLKNITPLEIIKGKRRASRTAVSQRRKSGSPLVGPSPLRNSVVVESSSASTGSGWELEDLVKDGELDIDAVTAVLGLGLSVGSGHSNTSDFSSQHEHVEVSDVSIQSDYWTAVEWDLGSTSGSTTVQLRVPGEQLTSIPEENEDVVSIASHVRDSVGSIPDADVLSASTDLQPAIGSSGSAQQMMLQMHERTVDLWDDEQSWRDSFSARENIQMGFAC
ncbi:uncharacterized protein LAESUDRAFT_812947 [Laetiporus sulphureus 93-53]|uniref:Uncharacterized protein n=1 Tax=Laetiporus sulphureus 93-53 TaxID=1314785 RepID=A0A165E757_9APHY|nr:uncharacterized protein LAESUDRAFT_812947 [Laetiporus sulphureus 93-53]KZT06369.1 hypothetical protein LAESUDRAFT_812947 [Laetiporus sulphureus 93-53]